MSSIPAYDIEENLRRIDMQRSLKFVVVEGIDDVPIYENIILSLNKSGCDFDVIHSGGKPRIDVFLRDNPDVSNCFFIVDRDFDRLDSYQNNVVCLERYSIENFYFCEDVIKAVIAMSLRLKLSDAAQIIDIGKFIEINSPKMVKLFYAIFYYQKVEVERLSALNIETNSWSDAFICKNNSWEICQEKVTTLIENLYPDGYDEDSAIEYYKSNYTSSGCVLSDFPGKMLKVALQRYIKDSVIKINKKYGSKFSNTDVTFTIFMSNLNLSKSLVRNLQPVSSFLGC